MATTLASLPASRAPFTTRTMACTSRQDLVLVKRTILTYPKRKAVQIWMMEDAQPAGFGLQQKGSKSLHKILTLDPAKTSEAQKFDLFARKISKGEAVSEWKPIGDILLEKESEIEMALKERRKKLFAAAQHQYPPFRMLNTLEELQYGFCKADQSEEEINLVDVKGKELGSSIPALLRVDDGVKPPRKRF